MKEFLKDKIPYILLIFYLAGCKEPFNPPPIVSKNHFLVVEGRINDGLPTTITLSRTRNVTDTGGIYTLNGEPSPVYESGARVNVEDDHGDTYTLPEIRNGQYGGVTLPLSDQYQYRLHIWTDSGEEYESAFVPVLHTRPIDSISWTVNSRGVYINVSTHNDQDNVGYYFWAYKETWEFHAYYNSQLKYDPVHNQLVPRTEQLYYCWQSDSSTNILVGNTAGLKSDIVGSQHLTSISYYSEKMSVLYSIIVTQNVITRQEYNFWESLKKNTEELGSLFDPQPSDAVGNIHCITNPKELVVGYVGAGDRVQKRIFIYNSSLPSDWNDVGQDCPVIQVPPDSMWYYYGGSADVPLDSKTGTYRECADCTTRGTDVKPSFWP